MYCNKKTSIYIGVVILVSIITILFHEKDVVEAPEDMIISPTLIVTNIPTQTHTPIPSPTAFPTSTPVPGIIYRGDHSIKKLLLMDALEEVNDKLELCSYNKPSLYDTYSDEELELLFRVVEAEVTDYDIECKSHVASVIFNRIKKGWWDGDLTKILTAKRQFEVITNGRYKRVEITEETVLACEIAFEQDTAQGALFFDSTKGKSWAHENREYIFSDDAHWFYK